MLSKYPDTSGRDSLFQAEARRCKDIIEFINKDNTKRHFCIFDELYSGTNPDDAIDSAKGFIQYLIKKPVQFLLTTHYFQICTDLKDEKVIENNYMNINDSNNNIVYTYKLKKGISKIKGGKQVLKDLGYPDEIIN